MTTLDELTQDGEYYGELGRHFLSNSDIYALLKDPAQFKKSSESLAMIQGRYFHTAILEKDKLKDFDIIDASTRNTKIYKDACAETESEILLLRHEAEELSELARVMLSNIHFYDLIYDDENKFEQPAVKEIGGEMWKGKADIVNPERIIDLKTTSDIERFEWSFRDYNYDSQAWLYEQFFGVPVTFLVICKKTGRLAEFKVSEQSLERGKEKVFMAIEQYQKFFGPNKTVDINSYFIQQIL